MLTTGTSVCVPWEHVKTGTREVVEGSDWMTGGLVRRGVRRVQMKRPAEARRGAARKVCVELQLSEGSCYAKGVDLHLLLMGFYIGVRGCRFQA